MTNKEASDILKRIRDGLDEMVELNGKSREAFDAALVALEAERKTGKWIDGESIFFGGKRHCMPMTCSCCGRTALNESWKFCPNCGCQMERSTE